MTVPFSLLPAVVPTVLADTDLLAVSQLVPTAPVTRKLTVAQARVQFGYPVINAMASPYNAVGDGVTDDTAAVQAATAAALLVNAKVWLSAGFTFGIKAPITLAANQELTGPGTLKALAGFVGSYMVLLATNARLTVGTMDGTGLPVPTGAWTGAGVGLARCPVGVGVFINGSAGSTIPNTVTAVDTFQNFPSGPICGFYADGAIVQCRLLTTVQTYLGGESNGVVSFNYSANVRYYGGLINGFNWKAWYFGNCTDSWGRDNTAINGATGMASHYDGSGVRCGFYNAAHDGSGTGGDGYKTFGSAHPFLRGMLSKSSTGAAANVDACSDWEIDGLHATDPANGGVYITADTAPCVRGKIRNWSVTRAVQGTTANHVAIKIVPLAAFAIDGVDIDAGTGRNGLFGLYCPAVTSAVVAHVTVGKGVQWEATSQYDIFGYFQSIDLAGQVVRTAGSGSGTDVFLSTQSGVQGELCMINGLKVTGFANAEIAVELAGSWDVVTVDSLKVRKGGKALITDAGSVISHLNLNFIEAFDVAQANAIDLNFTTANTTKLTVGNVQLPTAAGGVRAINTTVSGGAILVGYGVQTLVDAATILSDVSAGKQFAVTVTASRIIGLPSNPRTGDRVTYTIIQNATGGWAITWNAAFKVSWSDTGNTLSKRSTVSFVYDGTSFNQDGAQTPYV